MKPTAILLLVSSALAGFALQASAQIVSRQDGMPPFYAFSSLVAADGSNSTQVQLGYTNPAPDPFTTSLSVNGAFLAASISLSESPTSFTLVDTTTYTLPHSQVGLAESMIQLRITTLLTPVQYTINGFISPVGAAESLNIGYSVSSDELDPLPIASQWLYPNNVTGGTYSLVTGTGILDVGTNYTFNMQGGLQSYTELALPASTAVSMFTITFTAVPEPSAWAAMAGLVIMAFTAWHRYSVRRRAADGDAAHL